MVRIKNALNEYYVGEAGGEDADLLLAEFIQTIDTDDDENIEEFAFYDGDGTPEDDVIYVKRGYTFEGLYSDSNEAMKFIGDLKDEVGEARKITFKHVKPNGQTFIGPAVVSGIKTEGGDASEFEPFECTIRWSRKPEMTETPAG